MPSILQVSHSSEGSAGAHCATALATWGECFVLGRQASGSPYFPSLAPGPAHQNRGWGSGKLLGGEGSTEVLLAFYSLMALRQAMPSHPFRVEPGVWGVLVWTMLLWKDPPDRFRVKRVGGIPRIFLMWPSDAKVRIEN